MREEIHRGKTGEFAAAELVVGGSQAEPARQHDEELYHQLFDSVNDAIFLRPITPKGPGECFVEVNAAACRWLGYSREELKRKSPLDIDPDATAEKVEARAKQLLAQSGLIFQTGLVAKDGGRIPVEISSHLFVRAGQQMMLSIARNLTERAAAEAALRASERRFREMMENVRLIAVMLEVDGRILFANHFLLQLTGWRAEDVIGKNWFTVFIPTDHSAEVKELFSSLIQGVSMPQYENPILTRSGERRDILWNNSYLKDDDGKIIGLSSIGEDITARKKMEADLAFRGRQLNAFFKSATAGLALLDKDLRYLQVSDTLAEMNGVPAEQHVGKTVREVIPRIASAVELILGKVVASKAPILNIDVSGETLSQPGVQRHWVESFFPIIGPDGTFEGVGAIVVEITERKNAEKQALAALNYNQLLLENSPIGIITFRATGQAVSANPAVARLIGATPEQVAGQNFRHLESWKESGLLAAATAAFQTGQLQHLDVQVLTTFGRKIWLSAQLIPFEHSGEPHLLALLLDITDPKRVEAEMKESEEKFRQLAENIHKVFWITDRENTEMLYVSPAYEKIWGRSCQSLYEQPASFAEAIHPADRNRVLASLEEQERGEGFEEEYRIMRPDGSVRWIHDRGFQVRNEQGEFYRRAGLAEDITEHRKLEDQFRQAQKMEAIGQLAGGVAHDFNNVLAAILMHLGLLRQNPQLSSSTKESLREVESEAMRAANLTRQLLLFSRRHAAQIEPLDMNSLIKELLKMLRRLLGENIEVIFQGSCEPIWVRADVGMMEQVLMNLCVNARDAMPKGGRLTLATTIIEFGAQSAKSNPDARAGRFVCLEVTDTGCGMDETVLKRIFEPFFTTKEGGKGTGLGLATVYGIVKQHEGWVDVESTAGRGSIFRVYLPSGARPLGVPAGPSQAEEIRGGSETILLVEDELSVRRMVALCLRKLGYGVLEAENGAEALSIWEQHHQKIELLFTDMVMPEQMTGLELAQRFRKEKASLRAIISSGYSSQLAGASPTTDEDISYLPKPYKAASLAKIVRRCLDKTRVAQPNIT